MGNPIPAAYNVILDSLMNWGKSGLIPNTGVIKSYHPPSIDNITGVAVPMPATIYKTNEVKDAYKNKFKSIDELPNASYTGSNIVDFNVNDIPTGPDTNLAHDAPIYGKFYKDAALTASNEETYKKETSKLNISTVADRMTKWLDNKPAKITDKFEDAQNFYQIPPLEKPFKDSQEKTPLDTRRPIPRRYELIPTRVPCAIPGILNCYMEIYDRVETAQPQYNYRLPNVPMYYKPDKERLTLNGSIDPNSDQLYIHMATDFTDIKPLSDSDPGDE